MRILSPSPASAQAVVLAGRHPCLLSHNQPASTLTPCAEVLCSYGLDTPVGIESLGSVEQNKWSAPCPLQCGFWGLARAWQCMEPEQFLLSQAGFFLERASWYKSVSVGVSDSACVI